MARTGTGYRDRPVPVRHRCRYGGVPTGGPTVGDMVGDRTKHEKAGSGINVCIVYVMYRVYETNMNRRRERARSIQFSIRL
jgi:hypothetical protein